MVDFLHTSVNNYILGEFSYLFYDLIAPHNKRPRFAQVYTLDPDTARQITGENLDEGLNRKIKEEIVNKLTFLMKDNPYAQTLKTTGEILREAEQKTGKLPHFQVLIKELIN